MKKILVTGAKGFLGQFICGREEGFLPHIKELDDSFEIKEDISHILHLAGANQYSKRDIESSNKESLNVVLNEAKRSNALLIFPSSCGLYGYRDTKTPFSESDVLDVEQLGIYQRSKLECENLIKDSGCRYIILRIFNIYGDGQKKPFIIPEMIESRIKGEKFRLNKPALELDFVHAQDVLEIIKKLIKNEVESEVVNLGSGVSTSLKDLGALILGDRLDFDQGQKSEYNFSNNKKLYSLIGQYHFKNLKESLL